MADLVIQTPAPMAVGDVVDARRCGHTWDLVVLCAEEVQDGPTREGARVLRAPMRDEEPLRLPQVNVAVKAARQVALALRRGESVLVTCHAGLNRSGLVAALSLCMVHGMAGKAAVKLVRRARGPYALSNDAFRAFVEKVPERRDSR